MAAGSNNIVSDGLVYCLDAANKRCYSGTGDTGVDLALGGTATLVNQVTFGSNNMGVFAFDGTDDYIEQDWSFTLGTGDLTIEFWVKMDWIISPQGANVFLSVTDPDVHEQLQFGLEGDPAQRLAVYLQGGSNGTKTGDEVYSWSTDQWYHLVASRISSTVALYRDGVSLTVATGATNTGNVAAISAFLLGNQYKSTQYKHDFKGDMGPIRIYNKGLTAAEVKQNYEATKPRFVPRITKSGLVGNWDAGDPESYNGGSTWKDTANDNNGTLSGDTFFNTAGGGSFTFNSADDYVTIANESNFDIGTACTITAWVYLDSLGDSDYGRIIDKASALSSSTLDGFHFHCNTSNSFGAAVGCSTTNARSVSATSVLSLSTWMHLVMVFNEDGSKKIKQYKDGVKLTLATDTAGAGSIDNSSVSPRIGNYAGDTSRSFDGDIAVVRFYDKALSAAEILDNYNKTKGRFGH